MSIIVQGAITIARKSGKRGDFNVGDLSTEIGEFEVKDALIEEFDPGRYTGRFVIDWIQPDSFTYRGRVFVKNRAKLAEILIDEGERGEPQPQMPPEPDPIEAERAAAPQAPAQPDAANAAGPESQPAFADVAPAGLAIGRTGQAASPEDPDLMLFGAELNAFVVEREAVKLDPTVDRQQFRAQRDRLKAIGYRFNPKTQEWLCGDANDIPF
ncbi:MAG: DUF3275 family protein [Rubrivivax sp.]|nr:DUF3275 family protein [Rubrivivax sp.]